MADHENDRSAAPGTAYSAHTRPVGTMIGHAFRQHIEIQPITRFASPPARTHAYLDEADYNQAMHRPKREAANRMTGPARQVIASAFDMAVMTERLPPYFTSVIDAHHGGQHGNPLVGGHQT